MRRFHYWLMLSCVLGACGGADDGIDQQTAELAREHLGDRPVATAAVAGGTSSELVKSEISYGESDDQAFSGYLARPSGDVEGRAGLIVIHEWWGLNDNIRAIAERLAAQGYVALAVDLYDGETAADPDGAREAMQRAMSQAERLEANMAAAAAYLRRDLLVRAVGSIGWCFGGGWSLRAGVLPQADVDAVVMYYGPLLTDSAQLERLRGPLLGIFADQDAAIPVAQVETFADALGALQKTFEIIVYANTQHAFANPSGTRYQAIAAEQAWARTLAFLDEHL
jgi:carboxymethylenebutenolidase